MLTKLTTNGLVTAIASDSLCEALFWFDVLDIRGGRNMNLGGSFRDN